MKKKAALVLWPDLTKRCKSPFFLVNEYDDIIFPHKIKQKHFILEKKYETIPRAKKEAAVGNVFKHVLVSMIILILYGIYVLAIHNVPLLLNEYGDPKC